MDGQNARPGRLTATVQFIVHPREALRVTRLWWFCLASWALLLALGWAIGSKPISLSGYLLIAGQIMLTFGEVFAQLSVMPENVNRVIVRGLAVFTVGFAAFALVYGLLTI